MSGSTFLDALDQARQLHRRASLRDMRSRYAINWYVAGLGLATREARRDRQAYESAARENGVKLNKNSRENPAIGLAKIAAGDPSLKVPHWTHAAAYLAVPPNGDPPPETLRAAYSYIGLRGGVESLYKLWSAHKRPPDETNDGPPSFTTQWADDALDGIPSDFLAEFEDHEADRYVLALIRLGDSEGVCDGYVLEEADELELLRIVRRIKRRPVGEDGALSYDARQRAASEHVERTRSTTEQVKQVVERIKSKMTEQGPPEPAPGEEPAPSDAAKGDTDTDQRLLAIQQGWLRADQESPYHWWCRNKNDKVAQGYTWTYEEGLHEIWPNLYPRRKFDPGRVRKILDEVDSWSVCSLDEWEGESDYAEVWERARKALAPDTDTDTDTDTEPAPEPVPDSELAAEEPDLYDLAVKDGWLLEGDPSPFKWWIRYRDGGKRGKTKEIEETGYARTLDDAFYGLWNHYYYLFEPDRIVGDIEDMRAEFDKTLLHENWFVLSLDDIAPDEPAEWEAARDEIVGSEPQVKQPPMEGTCSVCARQIRLTTAGTVRSHIIYGTNGRRCKGGGWPPAKQRRANSIDAWEPVGESEDAEA